MFFNRIRKNTTFKYILVFIVALLAGEAVATEHALEHSFTGDNDLCFTCDKADNFQNSLISSEPTAVFRASDRDRLTLLTQTFLTKSRKFFLSRGPPLLHYF